MRFGAVAGRHVFSVFKEEGSRVPFLFFLRTHLFCSWQRTAGGDFILPALLPPLAAVLGGQDLEGLAKDGGKFALVFIAHLLGDLPHALVGLSRWPFMWAAMGWPYTALKTAFRVEVFR